MAIEADSIVIAAVGGEAGPLEGSSNPGVREVCCGCGNVEHGSYRVRPYSIGGGCGKARASQSGRCFAVGHESGTQNQTADPSSVRGSAY